MQKYRILPTLQKKAWFNFPNMKKRVTFALGFADMAQLVEQRIRNAWVRGSSPLIGSGAHLESSSQRTLFLCPCQKDVLC